MHRQKNGQRHPAPERLTDDKVTKEFYFLNSAVDTFIFNDDNMPCYQHSNIAAPTSHYGLTNWNDVVITQFMVPLPSKVYLDAYLAINQSKILLFKFADNGSHAKTFLASCKSLRNHIATSNLLSNGDKSILLNIDLPRFVWVTEFGSKTDFDNNQASGIIILDATEPGSRASKSLILVINRQTGIGFNKTAGQYQNIALNSPLALENYNKNIF